MLSFEEVSSIWREGERRLDRSEPADRAALERATEQVVDELRRRLGGPFTIQELAALYNSQGTDWVFDVAARAVPANPAAWDVATIGGAAFARYARQASDYRAVRGGRPPGMDPD